MCGEILAEGTTYITKFTYKLIGYTTLMSHINKLDNMHSYLCNGEK